MAAGIVSQLKIYTLQLAMIVEMQSGETATWTAEVLGLLSGYAPCKPFKPCKVQLYNPRAFDALLGLCN